MNEKLFAPNTGISQLGIDVEKQKLPNLTTTPQILPYKFMGLPVYEVIGTIGEGGVISVIPDTATYILSAQGMKDGDSYPLHLTYDNVWKATDEGASTLDFVYVRYTNNVTYIDLGLPSGTLWGEKNLGARKATDYGKYFQWGDIQGYAASEVGNTEGKKEFESGDYKYYDGSNYTKYNASDGKTVLDASDDAATAALGTPWVIPKNEQFEELTDGQYTTSEWVQVDSVYGLRFTSKSNGNSIFLPAAGYAASGSVRSVGSYGYYWSASLNSVNKIEARLLFFSLSTFNAVWEIRLRGMTIRPVHNPSL